MTTLDNLALETFDCEKTFRSFCEGIGCKGEKNGQKNGPLAR